jgi:hypothetical protein
LIGAGHQNIGDYTLPQVEAFIAAIDRQARESTRTDLIVARAAQADGKDFKRIMKGYE